MRQHLCKPGSNYSTAVGTAQFWIDEGIKNFSGPGEYKIGDDIITIYKDKKIPKPDFSQKAHPNVHSYCYGQMFFGKFRFSTKQVLVMRRVYEGKDGKPTKIRRGKEIAQAGHGYAAFMSRRLVAYHDRLGEGQSAGVRLTKAQLEWLRDSFKKVTLQVNTEHELIVIYLAAILHGIEAHLITDSGLTEFGGVPTHTCVCLGPDYADQINQITHSLKLY